MKFVYSSYGHLPQYIYRVADSRIEKLNSQTAFVGLALDDNRIYQSAIPFNRKDRIFLFTDGVTESANARKEQFGAQRFEAFIRENPSMEVRKFNDKLLDELRVFTKSGFQDDIFILNIKTK